MSRQRGARGGGAAADELDSELPMLQFPQEQYWNVHVTVASSAIEIWIRIIGEQYSVSNLLLQSTSNFILYYIDEFARFYFKN